MAPTLFNYEPLIEKALRGVISDALVHTAKNGLMGDQHFYITFLTQYEGVEMPDYLKAEYPQEITIVLQHQFFGLKVHEDYFEVLLTFRSAPDKIVVPFAAITDFMDPSQRFELRFVPEMDHEEAAEMDEVKVTKSKKDGKSKASENAPSKKSSKASKDSEEKKSADNGNNVVTLDAFRKK